MLHEICVAKQYKAMMTNEINVSISTKCVCLCMFSFNCSFASIAFYVSLINWFIVGKLYGFIDKLSVIHMLKWLKNLFDQFIHKHTSYPLDKHCISLLQLYFANSLFIDSSVICVNGWLWMGSLLNTCMTATNVVLNCTHQFL